MHPTSTSELHRITAMQDAGVQILAIDLHRRFVAFDNGIALPVIEMRDCEGDVTSEPDECTAIDFGCEEIGFGSVRIVSRSWVTENN